MAEGFLRVAVTGGIGCGKSSVARFLAASPRGRGLDVDAVCRQLLQPGATGWRALRSSLPPQLFRPGGEIDRPALRQAIFADPALRVQVEALIHPLARERVQVSLAAWYRTGQDLVAVVEVPLLFEAGWQEDFDRVVAVWTDAATAQARLARRDGLTMRQAAQAMDAQLPAMTKALRAHHAVDNSGPWARTWLELVRLRRLLGLDLPPIGNGSPVLQNRQNAV
ncbi:MAG: dephospho-CoA kinase [Thermodesulfobacteriota bacterium]